jgi:hypothetical protein
MQIKRNLRMVWIRERDRDNFLPQEIKLMILGKGTLELQYFHVDPHLHLLSRFYSSGNCGQVKWTAKPLPEAGVSNQILPPPRSTSFLAIASPMPVLS